MTDRPRLNLSRLQRQRRTKTFGCQGCGCIAFKVVETKIVNARIIRKYSCRACGTIFHTSENLKKKRER